MLLCFAISKAFVYCVCSGMGIRFPASHSVVSFVPECTIVGCLVSQGAGSAVSVMIHGCVVFPQFLLISYFCGSHVFPCYLKRKVSEHLTTVVSYVPCSFGTR
jgi:hypothetical protein